MTRTVVVLLLLTPLCVAEDAVRCPSGDFFARYTLCSVQTPCVPEIVIAKSTGEEVRRFQVRTGDGPCASILGVHWAGEKTIGAVCHGNPSLSYYYEVDVQSGKVLREYLGYGFVRSPGLIEGSARRLDRSFCSAVGAERLPTARQHPDIPAAGRNKADRCNTAGRSA